MYGAAGTTVRGVKVRIGIGTGPTAPDVLGELVDGIDETGFDSLWLPEILSVGVPDPWVALAWAGARRPALKLGTTALVPGRNLVRLAKQAATLDMLTDGRLLLTLVPGLNVQPERGAVGGPARRGALLDEALPVLRRLWAGERVSHHGEGIDFDDVTLAPLPAQQPLEVWLGGMTPAALERCGRLGDGWLPALCTPEEAAAGRAVIDAAAADAGRAIDPEHFGVSLGYSHEPLDEHAAAAIARRARNNAVADVVPVGLDELRVFLERFVDVGFSKFVVRPGVPPASWKAELAALADAVGDLQT